MRWRGQGPLLSSQSGRGPPLAGVVKNSDVAVAPAQRLCQGGDVLHRAALGGGPEAVAGFLHMHRTHVKPPAAGSAGLGFGARKGEQR